MLSLLRTQPIAAEKTPQESFQHALEAEQTQWSGHAWVVYVVLNSNYRPFGPVWTKLAAQLCGGGSAGQSHLSGSVADAMGRLPLAMANGQ